jgi:hypothetical protein
MARVTIFSTDGFCVNVNSCAIPITKRIVIPFFSLEGISISHCELITIMHRE